MSAYQNLTETFRDIWALVDAMAILNRDMITVMPSGAGNSRTQQMVTLSKLHHERLADPCILEWAKEAENDNDIQNDEWKRINLDLMKRAHLHASAVPGEINDRLSALESIGHQNHMGWRETEDWNSGRTHLQEIFDLKREIAKIKQQALGTKTPYDALIDQYDPYSDASQINGWFAPVQKFLKDAIPQALNKQKGAVQTAEIDITGPFPKEKQARLYNAMANALGFDFTRGRMEMIQAHPSCYGAHDDSRFTTRIDEDSFIEPLRAAVHEIGHGLYEQNIPFEWQYNNVGMSQGMTIHESQSLVWERQISLHPAFNTWLSGALLKSGVIEGHSEQDIKVWLSAQKSDVVPSLIRIEADEMTYPLHIFLRFELEQKIIAGELEAADLPEAWNSGLQERLGIAPDNYSDGCLQDIHWICGDFGYFPSYSLGAMCAAQIEAAMKRDIPNYEDHIAKGEFKILLEWLVKNIHTHGSRYKPMELMEKATGEALNPKHFIDHLSARYL